MDTLYVHPLGMLLAHKNITLSGNNIGLYTINNEVSEVKRIIKDGALLLQGTPKITYS